MTPHKHADLIKQWADGAIIEWQASGSGLWSVTTNPGWNLDIKYRVKPVPKSDGELLYLATLYKPMTFSQWHQISEAGRASYEKMAAEFLRLKKEQG